MRQWQFLWLRQPNPGDWKQCFYDGRRIGAGVGLEPGRIWLHVRDRSNPGRYDFTAHANLPFSRWHGEFYIGFRLTLGWRRADGSWRDFRWPGLRP